MQVRVHELGDDVHVFECGHVYWGEDVQNRNNILVLHYTEQLCLAQGSLGVEDVGKNIAYLLDRNSVP